MQYNGPDGTLNITDSVNLTGATMTVSGNAYLASGTALSKRVAAISPHYAALDLGIAQTMDVVIPPNTAPNFIMVTSSAYLGAAQGDTVESTAYVARDVAFSVGVGGLTLLHTLRVQTYGMDSGANQKFLEAHATVGSSAILIAGTHYDPSLQVTINMGAAAYNHGVVSDRQHRINALCG
jgi:hypothetical protein